jgi:hypothetical protein
MRLVCASVFTSHWESGLAGSLPLTWSYCHFRKSQLVFASQIPAAQEVALGNLYA